MIHDLVEGANRTVSLSLDIPSHNYASMPSDETYLLSIGYVFSEEWLRVVEISFFCSTSLTW